MFMLLIAALSSSVCLAAHTPASIPTSMPSTKIVSTSTAASDLIRTASQGSEKEFETLLSNMEMKDSSHQNLWRDKRGTPLLLSLVSMALPSIPTSQKYERMIERFLTTHSDLVSAQDKAYVGDGRTALHQAAANGNLKILNMLIKSGATINVSNSNGETPLHFAARFGQLEAVKILIASGAKLNEKSKFTKATPLLAAAESGHESIIRELLDAGAKKSDRDVFGKTAPERYSEYVANYHRIISRKNN